MPDQQYDAFISYRRSDGRRVATWLRNQLENYKPPKALRHKYPQKLRAYLDTAYERATSDFYDGTIKPALLASRHLILVATPDAAKRRTTGQDWMQRESEDFLEGPNPENVLAVRAMGDFDGPLPEGTTARFPNIEIIDLRGASPLWFLNPLTANRLAAETLKIAATLLRVDPTDMPALRQEEERRQQSRLGTAAGLALALLATVTALSVYALQSRWAGESALKSSRLAISRLILSVNREIPEAQETSETRSNLINESCDVLDKISLAAAQPPDLQERVVCMLERATGFERVNEHQRSLELLDHALTLSAAAFQSQKPTWEATRALNWTRVARTQYFLRTKSEAKAEAEAQTLTVEMKRAALAFDPDPNGRAYYAEALRHLGEQLAGLKKFAPAGAAWVEAAAQNELASQRAKDTGDHQRQDVLAYQQISALMAAAAAFAEINDLVSALAALQPAWKVNLTLEPRQSAEQTIDALKILRSIAWVERKLGRPESASTISDARKRIADITAKIAKDDQSARSQLATLTEELANVELMRVAAP